MRFRIIVTAVTLCALALAAVPALAGGWAVATLDELPGGAVAGQPLEIGFTVRQHGRTPWEYDGVRVLARPANGGAGLDVPALSDGEAGHYTATLTLPRAGTWDWFIETGLGPQHQPMPPLTVAATATLPSVRLAATPRVLFTHAGIAAAAAFAARHAGPGEATGQALFVAKGCVVCHAHAAMTDLRTEMQAFEVGPNLSHVSRDALFLRGWLKNPSAVKPGAEMPALGLSDTEIEALIAFLRPMDTAAGR